MKKFIFYSLLIFLLFYSNIYTKSNSKEIQLPGNVSYVCNTDNYMGVICKTYNSFNRFINLFDKNGNKVFEKYYEDYFVHQIIINEKYQYIIIVSTLTESNHTYGKQEAFNIKTGSIVWETDINSIEFEQSPDGEKLLTTVGSFETVSKLQIISICNGSVYAPTIKTWENVAWLDSKRIIIADQIMELSQKYLEIQKNNYKERSELIKQKHDLMRSYNDGEVPQKEYELKLKQIQDRILNTADKKTTKRGRGRPALKWGRIGTLIKIYNIETHQTELEKEIYDINGKGIAIARDDENKYSLTVDEDGYIFLYGFQKEEKNTNLEYFLFKFDNELKPIWKSNIMEKWSKPKRLIYKNKKEIIISRGGKTLGMFDKESGKIKNNIPNLSNLEIVNFNDLSNSDIININGYQLHKKTNMIKFHMEN